MRATLNAETKLNPLSSLKKQVTVVDPNKPVEKKVEKDPILESKLI